jgi:hypothetical protein
MENWTVIMHNGKQAGKYRFTPYWFTFFNLMDEPLVVFVYNDKEQLIFRQQLNELDFTQIHAMHMTPGGFRIKVVNIVGVKVWEYLNKK